MNKLLSILVPTYNRYELFKICINSILRQTYKNIEIIVIDDASDKPVKPFIDSLNDSRIKLYTNEKNIGSLKGDREHYRRFVYELMSGEYFIYITDDDYWPDQNFLERAVRYMEKYPSISTVQGSQLSEFYESESSLKTLSKEEIDNLVYKNEHSLINNEFYFFENLFQTGFYSGNNYLEKFSDNATSYNISITATVRRKSHCIANKYLKVNFPSKWQGGYEFNIIPALNNDIVFINEPCVVARIHKNNASFKFTQYDHYMDSIQSITNAFENIKDLKLDKKKNYYLIKIKKRFIKSLSKAYLHNSITILRGKKLSLTSKDNNKRYVSSIDILKIYLINKIFFDTNEIRLVIIYLTVKFFNFFNKND